GHWLRSTIKLWIQQNRGARHADTPSHSVCKGNVKHEMGKPVPGGVVQSPLPRQHIGHPARLDGRQLLFLNRGLHTLVDFVFRLPSQYKFCPYQSDRQNRSCGWRIKAERAPILRVPKLGTVECASPCAFYDADKAVRAFDHSFIAMTSEDHNCGVLGNGRRRRASGQSNLSVSI